MATARYFGGAMLGLIMAVALIWAGHLAHGVVWPQPSELGSEAMRAYLAAAPGLSLLALPVIWGLAAGAAGFVGARIGAHEWAGGAPAGVVLIGSGLYLAILPHPFWLHPVSIVLVGASGWLGARFGYVGAIKVSPTQSA